MPNSIRYIFKWGEILKQVQNDEHIGHAELDSTSLLSEVRFWNKFRMTSTLVMPNSIRYLFKWGEILNKVHDDEKKALKFQGFFYK